jgi:serine protease
MPRTKAATIAIAGTALAAAVVAVGATASPRAASSGPGAVPAGIADRAFVPDEVVVGLRGGGERVIRLPQEVRPRRAIASLADSPGIRYANRNWVATAAVNPLDRGRSGVVGGWRRDQWNFLGRPGGVRVPRAWDRLADAGRPGAAGVKIAVVDTGIAYTGSPPSGFAASPDFAYKRFIPGPDLIRDELPLDENGHGTHVAGTIAAEVTLEESAPEGVPDLTGLAYDATLMPIRVLDRRGVGTSAGVAKGILWAARNGAEVINLSLQLPNAVRACDQVRGVCQAIRRARRMGALVVAAAGNVTGGGRWRVLFPAAAPGAMAVGASTEQGCLSADSHHGNRLDLLAPGGGRPFRGNKRCRGGRAPVHQVSFSCFPNPSCNTYDRFDIRSSTGTSMAAAHVSGVAALVRASGVLGSNPPPRRLRQRLRCTARPRGKPRLHGAGILDAARATSQWRCRG